MPRNTLILITALVLTTIILTGIAIYSAKNPPEPSLPKTAVVSQPVSPTLTQAAVPVAITFSENELSLLPGQQGKIGVMVNTHNIPFTGAQLDIAYDKSVLSNMLITPGPFGDTPLFVDNKASTISGEMTVAFAIEPQGKPFQHVGQIAVISFTTKPGIAKSSKIDLLPSTIITLKNSQTATLNATVSAQITVGGKAASISAGLR